MSTLFYEVARYASRAREHVRRRRFPDHVAAEAVQNALIVLWKGLDDPTFPRPRDPKAWLFYRSVLEAYVLQRQGGRGVPLDDDQGAARFTSDDLALNDLADDERDNPERPLQEAAREAAVAAWHLRVVAFCEALPPGDRAIFQAETIRQEAGVIAPASFRQQLHRARERAHRHARRFGLRSARRPE